MLGSELIKILGTQIALRLCLTHRLLHVVKLRLQVFTHHLVGEHCGPRTKICQHTLAYVHQVLINGVDHDNDEEEYDRPE